MQMFSETRLKFHVGTCWVRPVWIFFGDALFLVFIFFFICVSAVVNVVVVSSLISNRTRFKVNQEKAGAQNQTDWISSLKIVVEAKQCCLRFFFIFSIRLVVTFTFSTRLCISRFQKFINNNNNNEYYYIGLH